MYCILRLIKYTLTNAIISFMYILISKVNYVEKTNDRQTIRIYNVM